MYDVRVRLPRKLDVVGLDAELPIWTWVETQSVLTIDNVRVVVDETEDSNAQLVEFVFADSLPRAMDVAAFLQKFAIAFGN